MLRQMRKESVWAKQALGSGWDRAQMAEMLLGGRILSEPNVD